MEETLMQNIVARSGELYAISISHMDYLKPHAAAWDSLALEAPQQLPMLSHAWVASYIEHQLRPQETWFCLTAFDGDRLVGILPVIVTPHRLLGFNRPLLRAPFDLHTPSVDIVAERGREPEIISFLVSALSKVIPARFGLELRRLPESSPTLTVPKNEFCGQTIIKEFNGKGSFLRTTGNFDDYRKGLSSKFKRNLKNTSNKVARLPNVSTLFLSATEATEKELHRFLEIEASGWKGQAGTAILKSPTLKTFYRSLVRRLAGLGWLEWHFLRSGEKLIAGQFAVRMNRTIVAIKVGYDENYAWCSPVNYLYEQLIKRAFESNDIDEINFLSDMPWLDRWRMEKMDYYNIWIYPRRPLSLAFGVAPKIARTWGSRVPGLKPLYGRLRTLATRNRP